MSNLPTFTKEEVAERNFKAGKDCWLIYKNAVYNVTDYLPDHPGGPDLVTDWAGMDCTKAFNDAGHSAEAMRDLKKYKIGNLATTTTGAAVISDKSNSKAAEAAGASRDMKQTKKRSCFVFC